MRVYELARELGLPSREILVALEEHAPGRRTASSSVPEDALAPLRASRTAPAHGEPAPTAVETIPDPEELEALVMNLPEPGPPIAPKEPPPMPEPLEPEGPARFRAVARWAKLAVLWAALGLGAGMLLSITLPYLFGYRSLTVLSGSMEPTLHTGDVVVVEEISPLDVKIGDVVSFRDPADETRIITHRVRSMQVEEGTVRFVTKGDSNTGVEHWKVSADGTVGRVGYHVWRLGYALFWIRGRYGRLILVVIPALVLGAYELVRIWRPRPEEGLDEAVA
ncbi:MAG: signal peptidase I [Actinobacteria bacterium]|nr:signal peptidase I [Actinomycetota bacterium]